jgi:hypothetical protein
MRDACIFAGPAVLLLVLMVYFGLKQRPNCRVVVSSHLRPTMLSPCVCMSFVSHVVSWFLISETGNRTQTRLLATDSREGTRARWAVLDLDTVPGSARVTSLCHSNGPVFYWQDANEAVATGPHECDTRPETFVEYRGNGNMTAKEAWKKGHNGRRAPAQLLAPTSWMLADHHLLNIPISLGNGSASPMRGTAWRSIDALQPRSIQLGPDDSYGSPVDFASRNRTPWAGSPRAHQDLALSGVATQNIAATTQPTGSRAA